MNGCIEARRCGRAPLLSFAKHVSCACARCRPPRHPPGVRPSMAAPPIRNGMAARTSSDYHAPGSVEELPSQNVKSIAKLEKAAEKDLTTTDRLAASITRFCGSMVFVWVHVLWFTLWIVGNPLLPGPPLDPLPFSFLTLVVS